MSMIAGYTTGVKCGFIRIMWLAECEGMYSLQGVLSLSLIAIPRFMPYIGMVTILMNDYPQLKYVFLGVLGLFVLIQRE
jgi:hypothetical protein